jgi:ribosomal protein L14E/L6E/L27E
MKPELKSGIAAISRAGRDKGRVFVVLCELDANFVMVCNGSSRTLDRPKKKRRKHLLPTRHEMSELSAKYAGKTLRDQDIRKFLERLENSDHPHHPDLV